MPEYWLPSCWNAAASLPEGQHSGMIGVKHPQRALKGSLLLCLALAGCGRPSGSGSLADKGHEMIACAIGADAPWKDDCPVERDRDLLTIRHVDGGFRRFLIVHDGRGVVPADGAESASILIAGKGEIELRAGQDRYRLPAQFAGGKNDAE